MKKLRLLIADDHQPIRQLIRAGLRSREWLVDEADDWPATQKLLAGHGHDVVLLDVGLTRAANVKLHDALAHIKQLAPRAGVLLMTGSPDPSLDELVERGAVVGRLFKPFSLSVLRDVLGQAVAAVRE